MSDRPSYGTIGNQNGGPFGPMGGMGDMDESEWSKLVPECPDYDTLPISQLPTDEIYSAWKAAQDLKMSSEALVLAQYLQERVSRMTAKIKG